MLEIFCAVERLGINSRHTVGNGEGVLGLTNRVLNEGFATCRVEVAANGLVIPISAIYLEFFESLTFKEGSLVDSVHAVGDVDAREALAFLEGAVTEGVDLVGEGDGDEIGAACEGEVADGLDGVRKNHCLNVLFAAECLVLYLDDRLTVVFGRNFNSFRIRDTAIGDGIARAVRHLLVDETTREDDEEEETEHGYRADGNTDLKSYLLPVDLLSRLAGLFGVRLDICLCELLVFSGEGVVRLDGGEQALIEGVVLAEALRLDEFLLA